jgi:MFS transporter, DHA3 family, macrolide efflux protein
MRDIKRPSGIKAFGVVWIGQAISLLGTSMTNFALTIWAFQETGLATALALVGFFYILPLLIVSPLAGAIVDRSNRKLMMMVSDLASGVVTIVLFILYAGDNLQIWHLYIGAVISGTFQTFQWPAYSAAITLIVPKQHYARAHALNELAGNSTGIFAPLLAGALLGIIGLQGIFIIDIVSFSAAIGTLLLVHIPQPKQTDEGQQGRGSLLRESLYGFKYIFKRPSLLGLQMVFLFGNFFATMATTLYAPMILARTDNNALIFGTVQTAGAVGGLVGGLIIGAWGGPKRRVHGVLIGWVLSSSLGMVLMGLGSIVPVWAAASFFGGFFIPLINSSNQAIWQSKVAPDIQGRVFAIRRLLAWLVNPLATLLVGPLADFILEPAMQPGGRFSGLFGWLVGTGPGSGMALIIILAGICALVTSISAYSFRYIRYAEDILPDHKQDAGTGEDPKEPVGIGKDVDARDAVDERADNIEPSQH